MMMFKRIPSVLCWPIVLSLFLSLGCGKSGSIPDEDQAETETVVEQEEAPPVVCDDNGQPISCAYDSGCGSGCVCDDGTCAVALEDARYELTAGETRLIYRNDKGRLTIYDAQGAPILLNGTAAVRLNEASEDGALISIAKRSARQVTRASEQDKLGGAERLVITAPGGASKPDLVWTISAYTAGGFYTFSLKLANNTDETVQFAKAIPLRVEGSAGGGLFMGVHPSTHRILENGSYTYLDHAAMIQTGDKEGDGFMTVGVPGYFIGHSVSNWNHVVKDLVTAKGWVAGFLSFERATPVINISHDGETGVQLPDGRTGFSYWSAEHAYLPYPKPVPAGEELAAELLYVHPAPADPLQGVEDYASTIKANLEITLWHEKEGNRIPNGWNSWTGSGGTGGYGTDINEDMLLVHLDFMAEQFRDWGIDWFQIDDGYEPAYGDWIWREDRFPHGPRWLSDRIREKGLRPGLWISPLALDERAQTVADHPDWIAEKSTLGKIVGGYTLLDLTNPEVKEWVRQLFRKFRNEWNYDWLKMDFAYWALFALPGHDPTKTREEFYRDAVKIINEEIGDDTFYLTVSVMGIHYGLVHADRITLDSAPMWDWDPSVSDTDRMNQQGLKPTVRTSARRYYLHNRVWINHPDLIIFRSNTREPDWPRVTLEEAQAFCTYVAMSGGIVKMGDRLIEMTADHVNSVRKLLPIHAPEARPLDLFEREYPEVWHKRVEETLDGYDERWDIVGLFHWGLNFDQTTNPYTKIEDDGQPKTLSLELDKIGLDTQAAYLGYEFWTGTYLGEIQGTLSLELPPHTSRVVALREKLDRPQFVGWNRQIIMGATDIQSMVWDGEAKTLTMTTKVARSTAHAPFIYEIAFRVPSGFTFGETQYSGAQIEGAQESVDGELLELNFEPKETGVLEIVLRFE